MTKFNITNWAVTTNARPTNRCLTCGMPEIVEAISEAEALRKSGKARYSDMQLLEMLKEQFQYPFEMSALRKHLRRCVDKQQEPSKQGTSQGSQVGRAKRGG